MSDEKQNPKYDFKELGLGQSIKIKLEDPKAGVTGDGKYGTWYMWFGSVENATVFEGKGKDAKRKENHTGTVIFFPTEKLNEKLEALANGNVDVEVEITKTAREGRRGLIKEYLVRKVSDGKAGGAAANLTPSENKLINDANDLLKGGYDVSEELFVKSSQEPQYGGLITADRAKELFKYVK